MLLSDCLHSEAGASAIWEELPRFRAAFPCQVSSAAPPLSASDGRLTQVLAYVEHRAVQSLFYCEISALLLVAASLFSRTTGLLEGHVRRRHILYQGARAV